MPELSLKEIVGAGYASFWNCTKRYRVCKGSRASKKSKTTALNIIFRMMQNPQANTLYVRRVFATLKDSCFSDLCWAIDRLKVSHLWHCTTNPLEITYLPTGQKILFRGMDNALKITSISVPKGVLCWVVIEEAYELTNENEFNKLDLSIRGEMPAGLFKQFTLIFNPWSECWIKERFFDHPNDDTFTITTTYKCNEWLDSADLAVFERMRLEQPRRYAIEGNGDWGRAAGAIYERIYLEEFDVHEVLKHEGAVAAYGLDFGFSDPSAFVCCVIDANNDSIYIFDEIYGTGYTNQTLGQAIIDKGYGSECIIGDSAEPKSLQELRDMGLRAYGSRKGKDSVLHGIQKLQNYKLIVNPSCTNAYRELINYGWDTDASGNLTNKPAHEFSHCPDALRYCTQRILMGSLFSFD